MKNLNLLFLVILLTGSCIRNTSKKEQSLKYFYINTSGEKVDEAFYDSSRNKNCLKTDTLQLKRYTEEIQKAYDDFARLRNDNLSWTVDSVRLLSFDEGIYLFDLQSKRGNGRYHKKYAYIIPDSLFGTRTIVGLFNTNDNEYDYLEYAEPFKNNRAFIGMDFIGSIKFCYINSSGDIISPFFDVAVTSDDGKTVVYNDRTLEWILLDSDYRKILTFPDNISAIKEFRSGLAAARTGRHRMIEEDPSDRWGYIDLSGIWVIKPEYLYAGTFNLGFARVAIADTTNK